MRHFRTPRQVTGKGCGERLTAQAHPGHLPAATAQVWTGVSSAQSLRPSEGGLEVST